MRYPTCRGCGAILQSEGARCLICGFDPAAALTVEQLTDEALAYFETPGYKELLFEVVGTCRR